MKPHNVALQPRRLTIAPAAVGSKWLDRTWCEGAMPLDEAPGRQHGNA
jgi:hypothetical protein